MGFNGMENIKYPVLLATAFVLFFNLTPILGIPYAIIAVLFVLSPFVTLWMVYRVLKDAVPTEKTFDDYWYEDMKKDSISQ